MRELVRSILTEYSCNMMRPDPAKSAEFHDRHTPLVDALYREICASIPPDWNLAVLEVDVKNAPGQGTAFACRLYNPASRRALKDLPPSVVRAAASVHALCCEYLHLWVRGTFTVVRGESSERVMSLAHYDYPPLA